MKPRYELRFFIAPDQVQRVRDFVQEYLDLDAYSVGRPDYSYPVHTLHLDSDDWKLYWRTVRGDQDRWKLRVRYYSDRPDVPAYCEVKHQMTDVIVKHRAAVRPAVVPSLLAGQLPEPAERVSREPEQIRAVERFVTMLGELNARPRLHICCQREAYDSYDGKTRVTLDRNIRVSEVNGASSELLSTGMDNPLLSVNHTVILELRFTDRFPHWYQELVQIFQLSQPLLWKGAAGNISCTGLRLTQGDLIHNIVL